MPENAGPARTADSAQLRPHHVRSIALAGAVVGVVLLPIAAAQATPSQNRDSQASAQSAGQDASANQATPTPAGSAAGGSAAAGGVQALTPEYCGPARTSKAAAGGTVRAQTCVDQIGGTASARVYVSNGATIAEIVALNLTRTDGSVVQVQCTVAAGDASGLCATSPVSISGGTGAYNAIAELVGENEPVSAGVVHVESGLVAPTTP